MNRELQRHIELMGDIDLSIIKDIQDIKYKLLDLGEKLNVAKEIYNTEIIRLYNEKTNENVEYEDVKDKMLLYNMNTKRSFNKYSNNMYDLESSTIINLTQATKDDAENKTLLEMLGINQ